MKKDYQLNKLADEMDDEFEIEDDSVVIHIPPKDVRVLKGKPVKVGKLGIRVPRAKKKSSADDPVDEGK